jgi:2-keto-4-pentenoate hydratase/2-oxohepta-3-ene-1,7-dioic acid hydratase in catechol pathway
MDQASGGRIFCIGRNYAEHIQELQNPVPSKPLFFLKPMSCIVPAGEPIPFPGHGSVLHHEVEVVVRLGRDGRPASAAEARAFVDGITLGLDLTLRDVQDEQKKKGLPWEVAKAFDGSAPLGAFAPCDPSLDLGHLTFTGAVNGQVRQRGDTAQMLLDIPGQILALAKVWKLRRGDLLYTGTPAGVGPLQPGDTIEVSGERLGTFSWRVVAG